jgi:signal transduction histidine kinase
MIAPALGTAAHALERPLEGRRAVVVEDAPELAGELDQLLKGQGMEVLTVHSAEQVNGRFVGFDPQACIVDLDLRGGRGGEMLDLIGKLFPKAGAILLADETAGDHVTAALSARASCTEPVGKPIDPRRLLSAVARCVAAYDTDRECARAVREVARLNIQLAQANRAGSAVLGNLSHELRTPLNAIIGFSEMLGQDRPFAPEKLRDYAASIHQSGLHMLQVIETVLTLAALESGQQPIAPESIDLFAVLATEVTALQPLAKAAGVELSRRIAPALPRLMADPALLARVLHALGENAIEFARRRGKRVAVVARSSDLGGVLLQVADNGTGIEEAALERIERPFTVGEDVFSRHHSGLGLGLAITRKVMDLHDGELKIRSRPGIGTVVTLLFPEARSVR